MVLAAVILFIPVFVTYLRSGLVPRIPTLVVSGFLTVAAIQLFCCGLVLSDIAQKARQDFEFRLNLLHGQRERSADGEDRE